MTNQYLLDSCALIAYLNDEAGSDTLEGLFVDAQNKECIIQMHKASLAEVYYDLLRSLGQKTADFLLKEIESLPIQFIADISISLVKSIGFFKVNYKVSFADCFVLATAKQYNAAIITSDHHEFDALEKTGEVSFYWIR